MSEVLIALGQRLDLIVVELLHKELAIAHFADAACDHLPVIKFNRLWELPPPLTTIGARLHGTEFTPDDFLDWLFTAEALHRILLQNVEGLSVGHL